MRFFSQFKQPERVEIPKGPTTHNFFLGAPEAEAESTFDSKMNLDFFFEDYFGILPELGTEKFIVVGRKGCGKTAMGEKILSTSHQQNNVFCDFVKKHNIDLEKILQISNESGVDIQYSTFFEWIILVKLTALLIKNESIKACQHYTHLEKFLAKNSGCINLNEYQIKEFIKKEGGQVQVEYFKRFVTAALNRNFEIKSEKAPFFKLIPSLRETVEYLIKFDNNENEYVLIFDDLDIGFKKNSQDCNNTLKGLLRIAKQYNIDYFGKMKIPAKIILGASDILMGTHYQ